tara:strand:- start:10634 stop:10858 length:225 start_codon:yes stop_codon:yes gene_type:complete
MRKFFALCLSILFLALPFGVNAEEINFLPTEEQEIEIIEGIDTPIPMTQEEIDDLLGLDPYLGPTSWLGSKINK